MARHHHHYHHHYYDRDGGAEANASPNPHRLRRSRRHRVICGVCGGIAEYLGWKPWHVRLGFVLAFLFGLAPAMMLAYIILCIVMKSAEREPEARYHSHEEERFWRNVSTKPTATFSELRHRFRRIEGRVAEMERAVTADEYRLNKAFQEIE